MMEKFSTRYDIQMEFRHSYCMKYNWICLGEAHAHWHNSIHMLIGVFYIYRVSLYMFMNIISAENFTVNMQCHLLSDSVVSIQVSRQVAPPSSFSRTPCGLWHIRS